MRFQFRLTTEYRSADFELPYYNNRRFIPRDVGGGPQEIKTKPMTEVNVLSLVTIIANKKICT